MELPEASLEEAVELEELTELHPDLFGDTRETDLILGYLLKTRKIAIDSSSTGTVVKFLQATGKSKPAQQLNSSSFWSGSPAKPKEKSSEITEVDRSLATLKRTEKLLNDEIQSLEAEMSKLRDIAKARLNEGSRVAVRRL